MPFPPDVKTRALIAAGRSCCVCHKPCGTNIECHHIIPEAEGGEDTWDNCIPLCLDCHGNVGHYNPAHPKGTKFTPSELRGHRDAWYKRNTTFEDILPFHVYIKTERNQTGGDAAFACVCHESNLHRTINAADKIRITRLASEDPPNADDRAWFNFKPGNDLIWLEISLDITLSIMEASIKSYGQGDRWARLSYPARFGAGEGPFEYDLNQDLMGNKYYTQRIARIPIFESTKDLAGTRIINKQLLKTHLIMEGDVYSGPIADGEAVIGLIMPKPCQGL